MMNTFDIDGNAKNSFNIAAKIEALFHDNYEVVKSFNTEATAVEKIYLCFIQFFCPKRMICTIIYLY